MFDELTYYWVNHSSLVIDTHDTSIRSLSYCPLRMIAAEWSNYIELLGFGLKDGEIRQMGSVTTRNDLEHLDLTLSYLASWSRRVLSTKAKLRDAIDLIHTRPNTKPLTEDWTGLLDDYNHLDLKLSEYGKQLECNTGLLMSSVQLAESRQAFSEARNMSRLATLTLMFVPLNFVSSLFSMNDVVAPGTSLFWLYFAVAMPFLVVILFLMGSLTSFSWLSKRLVRRKPGNSLPF
jgi:Mg2+ and Co2+ transporter CorA